MTVRRRLRQLPEGAGASKTHKILPPFGMGLLAGNGLFEAGAGN